MANDGNQVEPTPQIEDIPGPQISGDQGGQGLSQAGGSAVDFKALQSNPEFVSFVEKVVQSKQDSRLGKYDTRLEKLESNQEATIAKYESLVAGGMSKEQAIDRMKLDEKLASLEQAVQGSPPSQPSAGTGGETVVEKRAKLFEASAISASDRRHLDFLRDNKFSSNEEYLRALGDKILEWEQADASKPAPSSGTVAQTVPSVPAGDGSYTKEKYTQDMLAARGKPDEVKRIKAAARADGVDVDNIGFT